VDVPKLNNNNEQSIDSDDRNNIERHNINKGFIEQNR